MTKRNSAIATIHTAILAVGVIAATSLAGLHSARAAECPADKRGVDVTKPVTTPAKDVTDTVLAMIDLAKEPAKINGRLLRLRRLVIQPGGVVPWHSHDDRPAIIIILEGEIYEYASNCSVPILHTAGDVTTETHGTSHWWKNTGDKTVVLLSADVQHDPNDKNM